MKKQSLSLCISGIVVLVAMLFAACKPEPVEPLPQSVRPVEYTPEVNDPVTNDFTMLKAAIGMLPSTATTLFDDNGFAFTGEKFTKQEGYDTKILTIWPTDQSCVKQGELYVKDADLPRMILFFKEWLQQFQASTAYTKLVRELYTLSVDGNRHTFSTPKELLDALNRRGAPTEMSASCSATDIYGNEYSISLTNEYTKWVELCIRNSRAGQTPFIFPSSDLEEADLHKDILIAKVDFLTFRYEGFYSMNVTSKVNSGNEIPFLAHYQEPGDFGNIKLYYKNTSNLLMDGDIIWAGCGQLFFPETFRAGLPQYTELSYPGQSKIEFINNKGNHVYASPLNEGNWGSSELDLQRIWQTVSRQKEFQEYYNQSKKKVAVYLYTPSVGVGDPADASYIVFVER